MSQSIKSRAAISECLSPSEARAILFFQLAPKHKLLEDIGILLPVKCR